MYTQRSIINFVDLSESQMSLYVHSSILGLLVRLYLTISIFTPFCISTKYMLYKTLLRLSIHNFLCFLANHYNAMFETVYFYILQKLATFKHNHPGFTSDNILWVISDKSKIGYEFMCFIISYCYHLDLEHFDF